MIPNVFISSTILDLQYLRDAVRDVVVELGLRPMMSEYSEVGFIPEETAESSCYAALQQCQIAIVIIGKRYGLRGRGSLSVTQNEYRTARDRGIPIFCLVDREVLSFKRIHDSNQNAEALSFPGLDDPQSTFGFVQEVVDSPRNNAILPFDTVPSVRLHLRAQFAHLFGELISRHADPVKAEVRDVLSEVRALRHSLVKDSPQEMRTLVRGLRLFLEERFRPYRELLEQFGELFEDAIPRVIKAESFESAIQAATGKPLQTFEPPDDFEQASAMIGGGLRWLSRRISRIEDEEFEKIAIGVTNDDSVCVNEEAKNYFEHLHRAFLNELRSNELVRSDNRPSYLGRGT